MHCGTSALSIDSIYSHIFLCRLYKSVQTSIPKQVPVCHCVQPGRARPFFTHTAGYGPLIPGHQHLPQSNVSASPFYFRETEQAGRGEGKTEVAHLHNSIVFRYLAHTSHASFLCIYSYSCPFFFFLKLGQLH